MSTHASQYVRSRELLARDDSRVLLVDMQERLTAVMAESARLIDKCRKLLCAAQILSVPISATEQYPKGLGATIPDLVELAGERVEKLRFSSAEAVPWVNGDKQDRTKVVVAGIEAHVCVQQTVLDLLAAGFSVYVPADAVASRYEFDWARALERMRDSGAMVTSTEAVIFEWCETAAAPEFKQISAVVTGRESKNG
jgi:isochorismate hydrolase